MLVGLLAQTGGLSTMLRIRILKKHEPVHWDWEEETRQNQGTSGQALSGGTFAQFGQLDHHRMVETDDWLSIIDVKHNLFYLYREIIVTEGEERVDDDSKPVMMTFHTMSLAQSQFPDHLQLCLRLDIAQLVVHGAIATNVSTHDSSTNDGWEFDVDCSTVPFEAEAGYNFRYDSGLKLVHNATEFLRISEECEVTSIGHNRFRGLWRTGFPLAPSCRGRRCGRCSLLPSKELNKK